MAALLFARRPASFKPVLCRRMSSTTVYGKTCPFVLSPRQLHDLREKEPGVVVLDASWHMPNSPRKAKDEFVKKRIPGARFLDLDEVASEHELGLKHMMPSSEVFARACGAS